MLELEKINKSFDQHAVLTDVSLQISKGGFGVLFGPSGGGKSTLLRIIAGLDTPDSGRILLDGRDVSLPGRKYVPAEDRKVGLVFQDLALFPHLTVGQNIEFGIRTRPEKKHRLSELLELVRLTELQDRLPHQLSGGEQQRVAVARALAPAPDLLLLDEPFANLDASLRSKVRAEMVDILKQAGATVIMVTHDREEALGSADHLMVMSSGRMVQAGLPRDVYEHPSTLEVAGLLGDGNVVACTVRDEFAECALGRIAAPGIKDGTCRLFVRSEHLQQSASGEITVRVKDASYFGHDALANLVLADGACLSMRQFEDVLPEPGDEIRISVTGPVTFFHSD
ncbi:MAG: ABC transporter [Planctomycetaceae bacterium]|nr:ABC transporter [Planctomycetaceae bacterium]